MRYSGLYFIPIHGATQEASASTLASLIVGIESHFEFATRQSSWSLSHRLLRSVPPANLPPHAPKPAQSFQHILHVSYLSRDKTYCYIHPFTPPSAATVAAVGVKAETSATPSVGIKGEPTSQAGTPLPIQDTTGPTPGYGTIIAIPYAQSESHLGYLGTQLSPLWAYRHALHIYQGITYTAGQYILNIGEVRMARSGPSSSSNLVSPGVVVCITTVTGGDGYAEETDSGYGGDTEDIEMDIEELEGEVRQVWNVIKKGIDFGKGDIREVMMGRDALNGETQKEAVVRMWCDALKLRG
ncbi:hypothetical protein K504DRAFT_486572 [Pleomassaria siparia CBS 279.74]|uniref:Mediator of RNA polymerase II transcription subunit 20 n=1 Tax=Pleomassaria siparia CBS 279.74 TaxID=1314801 RepID=A0A6G1KQI4_9PLEO|nr:hypothetical protein K504DRAFT_486572 [Pleomassaria siparia CBS 279.74]